MVLFIDMKYFNSKKSAFIFVFGFNKARAKLGMAKLTFLHTLCSYLLLVSNEIHSLWHSFDC